MAIYSLISVLGVPGYADETLTPASYAPLANASFPSMICFLLNLVTPFDFNSSYLKSVTLFALPSNLFRLLGATNFTLAVRPKTVRNLLVISFSNSCS